MADVTSIYGNPIKDAVARADIATNTQDISDLKDGLTAVESDVTDLKEDLASSLTVSTTVSGTLVKIEEQTTSPITVTGMAGGESVYVTSTNLFDISLIPDREGLLVNHGTYLTVTQNSNGERVNCLKKLSELCPQLRVGDVIYFMATTTGSLSYIYLNVPSATINFGTAYTVTQNALDSYIYFVASGASTSADISNIRVCFNATDGYAAYNSETYSEGTTNLENNVNYVFGSAGSTLTVTYGKSKLEIVEAKIDDIADHITETRTKTGTLISVADALGGAVESLTGATAGDTVYVAGRNLFNAAAIPDRAGYITNNNGVFSVTSATGTTNTNCLKKFNEVVPGVKVGDELTLSFTSTSERSPQCLYIGDASWENGTRRTVTSTIYNGYIYFVGTSGESYTVSNIQFWFGKTTGDYEAYRTVSYVYGTDTVQLAEGYNQIWALDSDSENDTITLTYKADTITDIKQVNESATRWNNKRMLVLGDSISADNYLGYPCWADIIAEKFEMELVNPSVHAVGYVCGVDTATPNSDSLINLIDTLHASYPNNDDFDLIVFFRGTNDYGNSIPIGSSGDAKTASFTGAVQWCFKSACDYWSKARIVVLTPMQRRTGQQTNSASADLEDYVDVIKANAEIMGFDVLDLFRRSGFSPLYNPFGSYTDGYNDFTQQYCLKSGGNPDGLHPNKLFTETRLYPMIAEFIKGV